MNLSFRHCEKRGMSDEAIWLTDEIASVILPSK